MLGLRRVCRAVADALATIVSPADCRACGGPLLEARRFAVCDACLARLCPEASPLCKHCGERLDVEDVRGEGFVRQVASICHACQTDPPAFERAVAFAAYDGTLRTLIRLHKFEGQESLATPLGEKLAKVLSSVWTAARESQVHVVAVPLFGRKRRYNQSEQIADAALRRMWQAGERGSIASHDALCRVRATESQSHLTPAQRRDNVRGAFAVTEDVTGWHVVLVDDVYTTGATAAECTRTLLRAGTAMVQVVTLARTQPERAALWQAGDGRI